MQSLLARIRANPDDADAAIVLGDARLQAGDPWGALLLARSDEDRRRWLTEHADQVCARWGDARLHLVDGLITRVHCGIAIAVSTKRVTLPAPGGFGAEPLATLDITFPSEENVPNLVAQLAGWPSPLFGLALAGPIPGGEWPPLCAVLTRLDPVLLDISRVRGDLTLDRDLPSLRVLVSSASERPQPGVERLSIRGEPHADHAGLRLADWPALRVLDLRGHIDQRLAAQLPGWVEAGGQVVHERYSLVERGRWARVCGGAFVEWPAPPVPGVVVAAGEDGRFVIASGPDLLAYDQDNPTWQARRPGLPGGGAAIPGGAGAESLPVSVASTPTSYWVLHAAGELRGFDCRSGARRKRPAIPVTGLISVQGVGRQVGYFGGGRAVLGRRSIQVDATRVAFSADGSLLGAVDGHGALRILDVVSGTVLEEHHFGTPLEAIAAVPSGWCVAARSVVWRMAGGTTELLGTGWGRTWPLLTARGEWVAWSIDPTQVTAQRVGGGPTRTTTWTKHYSGTNEPIAVESIALGDNGQLLVALTGGALNILDCETGEARKADEHPGQMRRRWVFLHGGAFLIAG